MKKYILIVSILGILLITSCRSTAGECETLIVDNRTPLNFIVLRDEQEVATLKAGGTYSTVTYPGISVNLQLRTWILLELIIISTEIEGTYLKKIIITLDEEGNPKVEFVGRRKHI